MKSSGIRLPLYGQLLAWFFLNLALLGMALFLFARAELGLTLEDLLKSPAAAPLDRFLNDLNEQLSARPASRWTEILTNLSAGTRTVVVLYSRDGAKLAGEDLELPDNVRHRIFREPFRNLIGRPPPPEVGGPEVGDRPEAPPHPGEFSAGGPQRNDENDHPEVRPLRGALSGNVEGVRHRPGRRGGPRLLETIHKSPKYWVGVGMPLKIEDGRPPIPGVVVLATDSILTSSLIFDFTPLWMVLAAIPASALFWLPFVYRITRTVGAMDKAAVRIAEGEFDVQLGTRWGDELDRLAASINHLAFRLQGFVTGQKRFLGDIAHELCTPLARMEMALGILEQRADSRQVDYVQDVREEVQVMNGLVNELLAFSRAGLQSRSMTRVPMDVVQCVQLAVDRETRGSHPIQVELPATPHLIQAWGDPDLFVRALGNVIRNAVRYAGASGPIVVRVEATVAEVVVWIRDEGPGVPEEALARLGEPFYRPDSARTREGGGFGLGLAIVKTCLSACGGTVEIGNRVPVGLEVALRLRSVGLPPN